MKILPVIKNMSSDIRTTSSRLTRAGKDGYCYGKRIAKMNNNGEIKTIGTIGTSVVKNIKKQVSIEDLPFAMGAAGMLVPIPLFSPLMFCLGKAVKTVVKYFRRAH